MKNNPEERTPEVSAALAHIEMIRGQLGQMGANGPEFDLLAQISERLQSGHVSPENAKAEANTIIGSKDVNF